METTSQSWKAAIVRFLLDFEFTVSNKQASHVSAEFSRLIGYSTQKDDDEVGSPPFSTQSVIGANNSHQLIIYPVISPSKTLLILGVHMTTNQIRISGSSFMYGILYGTVWNMHQHLPLLEYPFLWINHHKYTRRSHSKDCFFTRPCMTSSMNHQRSPLRHPGA